MGSSFGFVPGNLRKIAGLPRYLAGAIRSRFTPRNPNLWVIGSAFGPTDGALAFFLAAQRLTPPPRLVWLAKSDTEAELAKAKGVKEVLLADSRAGLKVTLRAGLAVVTHGFGDVNRYGLHGAKIIQLWHGAPLKKLHADSPAVLSLGGLGRVWGVQGLMRWAYRRTTSQISLLPTNSRFFQPFLASAFHLHHGQVQVLGEPRTDVLFGGALEQRIRSAQNLLAPHLGPHGGARVVLYAPTWRDGEPDPGIPSKDQWARISQVLTDLDLVLLIRPHPLGVGDYDFHDDRIRLIPPSVLPESMPLLWGVEVLITDYSSMLVDFVVTGRPFLLLAPDLEHYQRTRGLYVDYQELAGGNPNRDWDQVLTHLKEVLTDPVAAQAARDRSSELATKFHHWTDGGSADRVVAAANELVGRG